MARWVAAKSVRNLWLQFWQESHQIPRKAWIVWGQTLLIGLGILAPITFAITRYAQAATDTWLQTWDAATLPVVAEALPLTFARSITWESPGNLICMLPVVITAFTILVKRARPLLAASLLAAYGFQFALVWIGWGLWNRERPDLIANGIANPSLHSFPSGHAAVVSAVYGFLAYLWFRSTHNGLEKLLIVGLFAVWTTLVAGARLELGVHWPSDVIVGLFIGLAWLGVVIVATGRGLGVVERG